jgi:hypothetical protein
MNQPVSHKTHRGILLAGTLLVGAALTASVVGQEVLPAPAPAFKGRISLSARDSQRDFPPLIKAPAGSPNILLVLLDDVGFGASSTFGDPCATPTLDRLVSVRPTNGSRPVFSALS